MSDTYALMVRTALGETTSFEHLVPYLAYRGQHLRYNLGSRTSSDVSASFCCQYLSASLVPMSTVVVGLFGCAVGVTHHKQEMALTH